MKSIIIIAIPAVLILAGILNGTRFMPASGSSSITNGSKASAQEVKTIPVSPAPTIVVASDAGNVEFEGGKEGSVQIDAVKNAPTEAQAKSMTYSVVDRDNTIHILYQKPDQSQGVQHIDFKIQAPPDSILQVNTGGGNIEVSGFSQGIIGYTGEGNVRATNMSGVVRLNTGGGNVEAFGGLRGAVALTTSDGNISAESVSGEVKAQTGAGNVFVGGRPTGNSQLSTGSGDINAIIPADSSLSIHAATSMGHIHNGFGLPTNTTQMPGPIEMKGQIGSGANSLNIQTGMGNISIQSR